MSATRLKKNFLYPPILLLLFMAVFFVSSYSFARDVRHFHQTMDLYRQPNDAATIRSWMTFDYLNKTFALPPEYLRRTLSISDDDYPRLTVTQAAWQQRDDPGTYVEKIRAAIRLYQGDQTTHPQ